VPRPAYVASETRFEIEHDPTVSALLDLDGAPVHLIPGGGDRFEVELAFEQAVVSIEENGWKIRTRRIIPSQLFPGAALPEHGMWADTGYGTAMLSALDELAAWRPGRRISSDIESACIAIELAGELRRRALENRA
jgi:hypothetical protein